MKLGGLDIDLLTRRELRAELRANDYRDWRYRDVLTGPVEVVPNGGTARLFGPDTGWIWSVQRITIQGLDAPDSLELYRNDPSPAGLITFLTPGANFFLPTTVVVYAGNELWVRNMTADTLSLLVGGLVKEVPVGCERYL